MIAKVVGNTLGPGSLRPIVTSFDSEPGLLRRIYLTVENRTHFIWESHSDFGIFLNVRWRLLPERNIDHETEAIPLPVAVFPGSTKLMPLLISTPVKEGRYSMEVCLRPVNLYFPECNEINTWQIEVRTIFSESMSPSSRQTYNRLASGINSKISMNLP